LAEHPHRVGKPLFGPLLGLHGARLSTYRIVYLIDDEQHTVDVVDVAHRGEIYRRR
jgi:mRNA-degrading endonuclease RelE of RelBE toxin-antitoxin system